MSVTLDLPPEVEQRVSAQAIAQGMSIEAYLSWLIRCKMGLPTAGAAGPDQFEADMDIIALASDRIPILSPDAFSRESIYADHD